MSLNKELDSCRALGASINFAKKFLSEDDAIEISIEKGRITIYLSEEYGTYIPDSSESYTDMIMECVARSQRRAKEVGK